uniref:Uncharacterized protein n=1 Tax=Glossina austeni TaxID=7395 RepID=A0A1A9ULV4_GLOAU
MSTLPFLLSVADELDNINSQSYMDDFGLGFHPHRQFYRTPTIQLSLPAGTDWMQQPESGRHQSRYRSYRCYGETQNNLQTTAEGEDEDNEADENGSRNERDGASSSASAKRAQKFVSALNSNTEDEVNIDNTVQMYNLSKKCSKNYYRHGEPSTSATSSKLNDATASSAANSVSGGAYGARGGGRGNSGSAKDKPRMGYRLHTKCLEGNNSSSDESLQKVSSSIEFLTCFLLKKSRATKNTTSSSSTSTATDGKKS